MKQVGGRAGSDISRRAAPMRDEVEDPYPAWFGSVCQVGCRVDQGSRECSYGFTHAVLDSTTFSPFYAWYIVCALSAQTAATKLKGAGLLCHVC